MKKLTAILSLAFLFAFSGARSQQSSLKGTIRDTLNKQNLANAVVTVLRQKDSVMVRYGRSDAQGNFDLKNLPSGNFIIMVTYPSYADYVDRVTLEPGAEKFLGQLPVITKANLLQEVIVKQHVGAIKMKGDTTEYKADSFHVSANADVQELLRMMPGMQVNSKGEITAKGTKVEKVLVDGEEFFSDDPAVVTKNLRADAVDKIQEFDKKSDQATFSGVDDGVRTKTLNIQLKEDKKKGYFGKVEAGGDFDKYRYGKLLGNSFKGKRKLSAYVTADNTKFESLNWNENKNYAGDANTTTEINDDGGISIFSQGDDFSWGRGFPSSYTGGLHFSNKWDKDKNNSNNTYQYNKLNVTGTTVSRVQNILQDTTFVNTTSQNQANERTRHKLTSFYEWQIDSTSSIKFTVRASTIKSLGRSDYLGQAISQDNKVINESNRTTTSDDDNNTMNNNIFWRKKFKKKGRTISWNADLNFNDHKENGFLIATNKFYDASGSLVRLDNVDQFKTTKQTTSAVNNLVTYTEPLWKNTFLVLNSRLNLNWNNIEKNTMAKDGSGKYSSVVDTLTNHFIFNTTSYLESANIRYSVKKVNFSAGAGVGQSIYHLTDINKSAERQVSFTNFIPAVTINFTPKQQRRFNFNYTGNTRNPTLSQIQPIIDNTDPLNLTIGNANLKQAFSHNFRLGGSDYKVLKSRNIYGQVNYSFTENAISNSSTVDSLGRRVNQAINVSGNYNLSSYLGYGFDLVPSLNISFNAGPRINRNANRVNGVDNVTKTSGVQLGINAGYWSDKWINFYLNFNANYNSSKSSIRPDIITNYWQYNTYSNVSFKFTKQKLYIDMNLDGTMYQKTAAFKDQKDIYIFSPSIRKVLTKDDKWETKLYVNDVFNQNQGISRNASSNFISETTNTTIQRYFLLSLIYNFSKNGKPTN